MQKAFALSPAENQVQIDRRWDWDQPQDDRS